MTRAENFRLFIEKRAAQLLALVVTLSFCYYPDVIPSLKNFPKLIELTVQIGAISIGFLATIKAILVSLGERKVIRAMRSTNNYNRLLSYFADAIRSTFCLVLVSSFLILINFKNANDYCKIAFIVWMGLTSYAILSCIRAIYFFNRILSMDSAKENDVKPTPAKASNDDGKWVIGK